ncbi:MAG: glycosyltransferase family 4 protein [Candidatus Rokuibacteriota bacterium]
MSPLRILQLYPKDDYFTGAAVQLRELAAGLRGRGHDVVVATRPSSVWAETARQLDITHYPVRMASEVDLRSVRHIARIVRTHRIQVVHAQKGKARTLAMLAGLFVRIPVMILNRGVSFPLDSFNRLGYVTRRVTAIVAVCESIKRSLVAAGVPPEKIEVIYSGTDTDRFHPGVDGSAVRKELGLGADHVLITQIGVRSRKGNDDVIDAMVRVTAQAPHSRLLIVGARRPASLEERAHARGIGAVVRVLGYREDIPEILQASDCCVDASWAGHGLTGTLREALAVETPVVATDLEGNPELVRQGVTGLLVPARDVPALADAILQLVSVPDRARAMGRAGRALVLAQFSTRVKVERTEALYRRLLGAQTAS